ncbi:class I SAM-dependent methyltransferase [Aestuariirhabdus litorea]|uniref:Methyltransferase n=1 Tax=Aestuariirhabdus litorea TaxID=2528527 RepID=A0A3P3VNC7_9GAMM|nr:class I SAM-dependent methyltransferase [Aestuariirhabdus litorea]RRJ84262.1 methyltransferase [Aestuariirhabdus litorea]RWW97484.1 methyltransferase [Endozoicomonadaceae bacterium GTF-13]
MGSLLKSVALAAGLGLVALQPTQALADPLQAAVGNEHRSEKNAARDEFRHPYEVLSFFGVSPDMTVVEIWPASGWWTEILAPYLAANGQYYAAHFPDNNFLPFYKPARKRFSQKLAANPELYGKVKLTSFFPPEEAEIAPEGSADAVLTFRNVHNWIRFKFEQQAFEQFYKALKPGGVLGVVEHRAKPGTSVEQMDKTGYVTEEYTKQLAKNAGFIFEESSEVNANPADTKDHPKGVWTLPPTNALKDQDREKYQAIGESDRFVLRFRKPKE